MVVRNNEERSCVHFAELPPTMIYCKAIAQYHNQDVDIDTVKGTERFFFLKLRFLMANSPQRDRLNAELSSKKLDIYQENIDH